MAPAVGGALHDADVDGDTVLCRSLAHRLEVPVLDADALAHVVGEQFLLQRRLESRALGAFDPERVTRHERLPEHDEIAASRGRIAYPVDHLGDREVTAQPGRGDLRQTNPDA